MPVSESTLAEWYVEIKTRGADAAKASAEDVRKQLDGLDRKAVLPNATPQMQEFDRASREAMANFRQEVDRAGAPVNDLRSKLKALRIVAADLAAAGVGGPLGQTVAEASHLVSILKAFGPAGMAIGGIAAAFGVLYLNIKKAREEMESTRATLQRLEQGGSQPWLGKGLERAGAGGVPLSGATSPALDEAKVDAAAAKKALDDLQALPEWQAMNERRRIQRRNQPTGKLADPLRQIDKDLRQTERLLEDRALKANLRMQSFDREAVEARRAAEAAGTGMGPIPFSKQSLEQDAIREMRLARYAAMFGTPAAGAATWFAERGLAMPGKTTLGLLDFLAAPEKQGGLVGAPAQAIGKGIGGLLDKMTAGAMAGGKGLGALIGGALKGKEGKLSIEEHGFAAFWSAVQGKVTEGERELLVEQKATTEAIKSGFDKTVAAIKSPVKTVWGP